AAVGTMSAQSNGRDAAPPWAEYPPNQTAGVRGVIAPDGEHLPYGRQLSSRAAVGRISAQSNGKGATVSPGGVAVRRAPPRGEHLPGESSCRAEGLRGVERRRDCAAQRQPERSHASPGSSAVAVRPEPLPLR